ncbi:MAG TPA: DUF4339 domain-containing protein, partial [Candidatus Limnocylindria bacterium]|nr:DUF4339 domain-containing protein [Candidatus Limnocylindria bacterium]
MNYHLHHERRDLGIFPLEELQRRRQSGELSGAEYVWREGMADWQTLDSILQTVQPPSTATPPPLPLSVSKKKTSRTLVWAVSIGVVLLVIGVVVIGTVASKFVRGVRLAQQRINNRESVEVATKSITLTTNSATEADVLKRGREFRIRQWLEGYTANGNRELACDAQAAQMIEAWIDSNFGGRKSNAVDFVELGNKLTATPDCDDPLVLTVAGLNSIELHEKSRRMERALAGFPKSRHKAYPKLNAAVGVIDSTSDTNRVGPMFALAAQAMKDCFTDGSFRPEDQAEIAEIFIHGWGYNFFYRIRERIYPIPRNAGKPFEWLALVFDGEYHVMEAWKARGGGFANTVTEQGWKGFNEHLTAARKSYTRAWELRPDLPLAPCRMIYIALSGSDVEEMRLWFDRTVAAQIDYPKAWSDMRWGLRPRWHGSTEAMLALGKSAVDTGRFDTDVPRKFFDVVYDLESEMELPPGQHIFGRRDIWPEFSRMYEGYIAEPSLQGAQRGWRSAYAMVAYLAGKYDVSRTQLELLNWEPNPFNLSGWGTEMSLAPLEVAARTGKAGAQ